MSGRFVRASAYRHVFGTESKPTDSYMDIRPQSTGDGDFVTANGKFLAFSSQGGGGPLVVHPLSKKGRLGNGVPKVVVHKAKVLDFKFNPFVDTLIASGSEDCRVCVTAIPEDGLTENVSTPAAKLEGHQKKIHALNWHPTSNNVLASASFDYTIKLWDVEAQAEMLSFDEHKDVPVHLAWNTNGSLMGTCCKDKKFRIFDPRNAGSVIEAAGFPGSKKSSIIFADNKEKIVTVGFSKSSSRQFQIWDPKKMDKYLHQGDVDQSAGVFMTHYDPDTSVLFLAGKGDSSIKYFEIVDSAPYIHFLSEFRGGSSQKGIGWVPKPALDTTKCEIARGLRLMRDGIVPTSFCVPRKSDIFQADIFPDTYAGVSSQTAEDYAGGKDSDVVMTSMKPGEGTERKAVEFVAKKSPAELQKELDAANARIKELEAEVAKLKSS